MSREPTIRRAPVRVLRESVARKIAAGEVIDRPASAVRELIDNSLDASSTEIILYITGGGIESIRLLDNGMGMTEEDLRLCWLPHATSKIETEGDLLSISSLGFRGEALSALASVSRLEILSKAAGEDSGHRLTVHGGTLIGVEPYATRTGTVVNSTDLFYAIPARRKFLKRPSTETNLCRAIFLEKSLPFPDREFKLFIEGKLIHVLSASSLPLRISNAYAEETRSIVLEELTGTGSQFTVQIVIAPPQFYRKDRRHIQLFVNRRKIWDYSLIQGIEYAFSSFLPGGAYPFCYTFLEIAPELVDFNIHPAKKEARIRNTDEIRRCLVETLTAYLKRHSHPGFSASNFKGYPSSEQQSLWVQGSPSMEKIQLYHPSPLSAISPRLPPSESFSFQYKGQAFGLFLLVEKGERLYLVDQHAAHERVIYDSLARDSVPQSLLLPVEFEVEADQEAAFEVQAGEMKGLGVCIEKMNGGTWALTAIPAAYQGAEEEVIRLAKSGFGAFEMLKHELFSQIACKKAIKDGDPIDPSTAYKILSYVFEIENPRCPHGRPLWVEVSLHELFRGVQRLLS